MKKLFSVLMVLLLTSLITFGQVPQTTSFQGVLANSEGVVVRDGTYSLNFKLFNVPTRGLVLWEETQSVTTANGVFNVLLGKVNPLNLPFDTAYWLEMSIGGGAPLTPRVELSSSFYSLMSQSAGSGTGDNLGDHTATQNIKLNGRYLSGDGGNEGVFVGNDGKVGIGIARPLSQLSIGGMGLSGYGIYATGSTGGIRGYVPTAGDVTNYGGSFYAAGNNGYGVYSFATGSSGRGVYGNASNAGAVTNYGGYFTAAGASGRGVYGSAPNTGDYYNYGGYFRANGRYGKGVYGTASGVWGEGVRGIVSGQYGQGVRGEHTENGNYGFLGHSHYGMYGKSSSSGGVGVYATSVSGYAGYFGGDVNVTGTLSKGGGSFKIDHPLDPQNKNLYHSFVESPDMMNVYNGNITLNANGDAVVELPEWFEALNKDFRYQLTAIGSPGPNLYVAEEISGNQFKIAGGNSGMKVSWQVTGIRKDAFANANRIPVEETKKPEERGKYLHPKAYGMPKTMGVDYNEELEQERIHMEQERAEMEKINKEEEQRFEEERARMEREDAKSIRMEEKHFKTKIND